MKNRPDTKIKLSDVAERCGVSPSTVSRVLSGFSDGFSVTKEVRERIVTAAKEMNYVPNVTARQLRTKKTMNIQVFGFFFRWYGTYSLILEYFAEVLNKKGYMVNAVFGDYSQIQFGPMSADGIILITGADQKLLKRIKNSGVPFVVLNEKLGKDDCWISFDDSIAISENMEYMISQGHKKIVYCEYFRRIDHTKHSSIKIRKQGYLDACKKYNLEPLIFESGGLPEEAIKYILNKDATAVITYNVDNAGELVSGFSDLRIRVPEDIEIATFGYPTRNLDKISYTEIDVEKVGKAMGKMLLDRIEKGIIDNKTFPQYHHKSGKVIQRILE